MQRWSVNGFYSQSSTSASRTAAAGVPWCCLCVIGRVQQQQQQQEGKVSLRKCAAANEATAVTGCTCTLSIHHWYFPFHNHHCSNPKSPPPSISPIPKPSHSLRPSLRSCRQPRTKTNPFLYHFVTAKYPNLIPLPKCSSNMLHCIPAFFNILLLSVDFCWKVKILKDFILLPPRITNHKSHPLISRWFTSSQTSKSPPTVLHLRIPTRPQNIFHPLKFHQHFTDRFKRMYLWIGRFTNNLLF